MLVTHLHKRLLTFSRMTEIASTWSHGELEKKNLRMYPPNIGEETNNDNIDMAEGSGTEDFEGEVDEEDQL